MESIWNLAPSWANHLICSELGHVWYWVEEYRAHGDTTVTRHEVAAINQQSASVRSGGVRIGTGVHWILVASRPAPITAAKLVESFRTSAKDSGV